MSKHVTHYRGSTVLTMGMAYSNARLLARPDGDWLKPSGAYSAETAATPDEPEQ